MTEQGAKYPVLVPMDDHLDHRGFVLNPFEHLDDTGSITNCHVFSIEPGCIRGNHTHPGRNEEVLLLSGELTIEFPETGTLRKLTMDEPGLLVIEQGTGHLFENRGTATSVAICWSSRRDPDYEGCDTIRT